MTESVISLPSSGSGLPGKLSLGSLDLLLEYSPVSCDHWIHKYQWPGRFGMSLWKAPGGWAFKDDAGRAIFACGLTNKVTLSESSPECWHFFNRRVLPRLGVLRREIFLHGSAVAIPGESGSMDGIVIVGPSGAGKSTLAAALVQFSGAQVLADDFAYLEATSQGYRLRATENLIRLRSDSLSLFQSSHKNEVANWLTKAEDGKTCCNLSQGDGRPVHLTKIVVLTNQEESFQTPNTVAKFINANLLQFDPTSIDEIQRLWCLAAEIVKSVPIQICTRSDAPLSASGLARLRESVLPGTGRPQ